MTYKLTFLPIAKKEWDKLAEPIKKQFKNKLAERLKNPQVSAAKLKGYDAVYKIKLRKVGYRLVYEVLDREIVIIVLAVGKRDKNAIYKKLASRSIF